MQKIRIITLFVLGMIEILSANAQGIIKGILKDSKNNAPVDHATIFALNPSNKASVRGAQTDSLGAFVLKVPFGTYLVKASNLGFEPYTSSIIKVTLQNTTIDMGSIAINPSKSQLLNEVKVVGRRKSMELGIDKKVFSVDQSLVSQGGSATDLLDNVPSVQTDMDGNISLRGASPQVLINGKPSTIGGGDVAQLLQSIPAESIEKVEVITNPSSRFDAAGQSGIINIILKKNAKLGATGSATLGIGNRNNTTTGLNLAFQNSKWNFYGNYSTRGGNQYGYGYNNRTDLSVIDPDVLKYINQNSASFEKDRNHNIVLGADYNVTEKTTLSLSAGLNTRKNNENETIDFNYLSAGNQLQQFNQRRNFEPSSSQNQFINFDALHKFKKEGEELSFNFNYGWGNRNQTQNLNTYFFDNLKNPTNQVAQILNTASTNNNKNYNIQTDYVLPITNGKLEAGARSQIQTSNRSFLADSMINSMEQFAYKISNLFSSTNQIHAVYTNFQKNYGNFGLQIGLRLEKADLNTKLGAFDANQNTDYTPGGVHYTRLFPSVYFSQKVGSQAQLQLSYTRRVERPNPWLINPFRDVSDPINVRQGNPNLQPEDVHSFEAGFSKNWKNISFISTAYYRLTNDVVQFIRRVNEDGTTLSTPVNFAQANNTGIELIAQITATNFWNFNANSNFYQTSVQGESEFGSINNSGFSWNTNITNNFKLPYNISLQVRADYRSPQVTAQGKRLEMFGVDFGAKYAFLKNKASVSLNIRNTFNTRKFGMYTETQNFTLQFQRYRLGPQGMLTLSYNFGSQNLFKKSKKSTNSHSSMGDDSDMSAM